MFILNITFSVSPDIGPRWLKYAKTQFIPDSVDDGIRHQRTLLIHHHSDDGFVNYAIQFSSSTKDALTAFLGAPFTEYTADMRLLFGDKVLAFATIMEEI